MLNEKAKLFFKSIGIDVAKLDVAIKSATEDEIQLPDNKTFVEASKGLGLTAKDFGWHTTEDLDTAKANTKKGAEEAILEVTAKTLKTEFGITTDSKDLKEVMKAYAVGESTKAVEAAKIPIDDQLKERDKTISELRANVITFETKSKEAEENATKYKGEVDTIRENEEFARFLPQDYNPLLRPEDYRKRILEEEGIAFKKINGTWTSCNPDGTPLKDHLVKDIPAKAKIDEVFAKRTEWKKAVAQENNGGDGGGHGTGNSGGGAASGGAAGGGGKSAYKNVSQLREAKVANRWDNRKYKEEYDKALADGGKDFDTMG